MKYLLVGILFALTACATDSQIGDALEKNPDLIIKVIEKNPEKFSEAMMKANVEAQRLRRENQVEAEMKNPLQVEWNTDRPINGDKNAPVKIVEFTDFQCPFCGKAFETIQQVMKNYQGKVQIMYKNLPLPIHKMAMPAAKRFEAIAMQDHVKAYKFHDEVFQHQDQLNSSNEKFLDATAAKVGANVSKMKKDMEGEYVKSRIAADIAEASKLGIQGTPAFVINGVSIRGAQPYDAFVKIIERKLTGVN